MVEHSSGLALLGHLLLPRLVRGWRRRCPDGIVLLLLLTRLAFAVLLRRRGSRRFLLDCMPWL